MSKPSDIVNDATAIGEAIDGLLEVAGRLADAAGVTLDEWIRLCAYSYATTQGEQITDCKIELTLEERPPAN